MKNSNNYAKIYVQYNNNTAKNYVGNKCNTANMKVKIVIMISKRC